MIKFKIFQARYCNKYYKGWYRNQLVFKLKRKLNEYLRYIAFILTNQLFHFAIKENTSAKYTNPKDIQILHNVITSCNEIECFGNNIKIIN